MRITVGSILLGDYQEEIYVGGYSASGSADIQQGRGTATGQRRLRKRGSAIANLTVPTKRDFDTVSEAQKFCNDTALTGGYEGKLVIEYADGSDTQADWAIATPTSLSHIGVMVTATWSIEAGERLT